MNMDELKKKSRKAVNDISESAKKIDVDEIKEKGKKVAGNINEGAKNTAKYMAKKNGNKNPLGSKKVLLAIAAVFLVICFIVGNAATSSEKDKEIIDAVLEDIETHYYEDAEDKLANGTSKKSEKLLQAVACYNTAVEYFRKGYRGNDLEEACKMAQEYLKKMNKVYKKYPVFKQDVEQLYADIDEAKELIKGIDDAIVEIEKMAGEGKYVEGQKIADEWEEKAETFLGSSFISGQLYNRISPYASDGTAFYEQTVEQKKQMREEDVEKLREKTEAKKQEIQQLYDNGNTEEAKQEAEAMMKELGIDDSNGMYTMSGDFGLSEDFLEFYETLFE